MRKNSLLRVVMWSTCALLIVTLIYLMLDVGSAGDVFTSYENVKPTSKSNFSKKTIFLVSYVQSTGDLSVSYVAGMTKEEMQEFVDSGGAPAPNMPDVSNQEISGSINIDDLTEISKAICSSYLINGTPYYVSKGSHTNSRMPYGNVNAFGKTLSPYVLSGVYNRCCNGLSSGILFLCGVDKYNDGSSISAKWPYISCEDIYLKVGTRVNAVTAGDLRVGDIICVTGSNGKTCHVETVVKVSDGNVYIASAGSEKGILATAKDGYQRVFNVSKNLNEFYTYAADSWHGLRGVKRP